MILSALKKSKYGVLLFCTLHALCFSATTELQDTPAKKRQTSKDSVARKVSAAKKKNKKKRKVLVNEEAQLIQKTLAEVRMSSLVCEKASFSDMLDLIRATLRNRGHKINIIPVFGASDSTLYKQVMSKQLTLNLDDISIDDLLTILNRQIGIGYDISALGVTIDASGKTPYGSYIQPYVPRNKQQADKVDAYTKMLKETHLPSLEVENVTLSDMLALIHHKLDKKGARINIIPMFGSSDSERYKEFMSKKITLKLHDVSIDELLSLLKLQIGISYEVTPVGITVSKGKKFSPDSTPE